MEYKNDNRTPKDRIDKDFFVGLSRDLSDTDVTEAYELDDLTEGVKGNAYTKAFRTSCSSKKCCCQEDAPVPAADGEKRYHVLAMAGVEEQEFLEIYDEEYGWHRGTVFGELDLPFGNPSIRKSCGCVISKEK